VAPGRAAHQRDVTLVVLGDVVDVAGQRTGELLERASVAVGRGHLVEVVCGAADDGRVELLLAAEVVVEQPAGDPGLLGQGLDGEVLERPRREQAYAELDQLLAAYVRTHPDPGRGHVSHLTELSSTTLLTPVQYFVGWSA